MAASVFAACQTEKTKPTVAYISGQFVGAEDSVLIDVRDYGKELSYNTPISLDTVFSDTLGNFAFTIPLSEGKEVVLNSGYDFNKMFVEPGDSIYFETDNKHETPIEVVSGRGSDKFKVFLKLRSLLNYGDFNDFDSAQVVSEYDLRFGESQALIDSVKPHFSEAFNGYLKAQMIRERHYFEASFFGYLKNYRNIDIQRDSAAAVQMELDVFDNASIGDGNSDYAVDLMYLARSKAWKADTANIVNRITHYKHVIDSLDISERFAQQLLAQGYLSYLNEGKVSELEPFLTNYYERYPDSDYNETLKDEYRDWYAISNGQPAPDVEAMDPDGTVFHLSDLKGKVVYIDIWATWCGPCLGEMPHAKKIKDHYKDSNDIVFLYISVDENKEKWLKYLEEHPDFKGMQVNDSGNFNSNITKAFMVRGIPRYIIIDREGKIFSTDAQRPSSGEKLISELDRVLEEPAA